MERQGHDVIETVRKFILDEFLPGEDPNELTETTPLITGGILNSISTVKLVAFLEDTFGIEFEAHETGPDYIDTLADIGAIVDAKRSG